MLLLRTDDPVERVTQFQRVVSCELSSSPPARLISLVLIINSISSNNTLIISYILLLKKCMTRLRFSQFSHINFKTVSSTISNEYCINCVYVDDYALECLY